MVRLITYREWRMEVDAEATREAHHHSSGIGAQTCDCSDCRNFVAAHYAGLAYPGEFIQLLRDCGLEPLMVTELAPLGSLEDGRHVMSGWFHVVGRIISGPAGRTPLGPDSWKINLTAVSEGFEVAFYADDSLAPAPLREHSLIQVEFAARIPWLLAEPEPE